MLEDAGGHRTPGQLVDELLNQRGWTRRVLATVLGVDESGINRLISGKQRLDAKLAIALGEIFGVAAEDFMELQKRYDLAQARILVRPDPGREKRAHLFGGLPITEMISRGWLDVDSARNVPKVEAALVRFFGVASVDEIEILPHAAKKTNVAGDASPTQLAWLYRVKQIAREMLVSQYSPRAARSAVDHLSALLAAPEEARRAPRILAECGIRFVLVESLSSAKIDGACLWLDEHSPVIGMTMRHDRIDNFWFVLRHELEHILRLHGRERIGQPSAVMIDAELEGPRAGVGEGVVEEERIANQAAAAFCVPQDALSRFIARKDPFFASRDIQGFANTHKIHAGLVAGQLQHRTGRYDRFRNFQVKVRSCVAPSAIVDGWGDVAPTDA